MGERRIVLAAEEWREFIFLFEPTTSERVSGVVCCSDMLYVSLTSGAGCSPTAAYCKRGCLRCLPVEPQKLLEKFHLVTLATPMCLANPRSTVEAATSENRSSSDDLIGVYQCAAARCTWLHQHWYRPIGVVADTGLHDREHSRLSIDSWRRPRHVTAL